MRCLYDDARKGVGSAMSARARARPTDDRIAVSVTEMARLLSLSRAKAYRLLGEEPSIETRYLGGRRLVLLDSLRDYIDSLPQERAV